MSQDVGTEIVAIESTLKSAPDIYWGDVGMRDRYGALLRVRDGAMPESELPAAKPLRSADGKFLPRAYATEIERIQSIMHTPEYWGSETLQSKYRDLISKRDGLPGTADGAAPEWASSPETAVKHLVGIEDADSAREFAIDFDILPQTVRAACLTELATERPRMVAPATDGELETFRIIAPHFEAAWGKHAREHVAQFFTRFNRAHDTLSAPDARRLRAWFWDMPANERYAVVWRLAN